MAKPHKFGRMGRITTMIALTLSYFIVEIVVGHITGSIALVADSFHMLSDVVALAVGLAAVRISKMNSPKSTFGWVRAEVLGALVNAVFLLALCFTIFVDAVQRLVSAESVENLQLLLIVGSVGLGINLIGLLIFHDHPHSHGGHDHGHTTIAAEAPEEGLQAQHAGADHVAVVVQAEDRSTPGMYHAPSAASCTESQSVDGGSSYFSSTRQLNVSLSAGVDQVSAQAAREAADGESHKHSHGKNHKHSHGENHKHSHGKNHKHSHGKKGPQSSSQLNMRGIFLHVLGDALGSVVVIVSALLMWLVPDNEGEGHINWKPYIDPVLSLILVGIIIATTIPLLKESALILLQAVPMQLSAREMKAELQKIEGVVAVHELHVWQLAGSRHVASLHLSLASLQDYLRLSSLVKSYFHDKGVHSITIQPEFTELQIRKEGRDCALECGPEKSCYTDTCCGKRSSMIAHVAQPRLLQLLEDADAAGGEGADAAADLDARPDGDPTPAAAADATVAGGANECQAVSAGSSAAAADEHSRG